MFFARGMQMLIMTGTISLNFDGPGKNELAL